MVLLSYKTIAESAYRKNSSRQKTKRMKNAHFNYKLSVSKTSEEVFDKICSVSKWWTTDVEGVLEKLHDEFTVHFGESFVNMQVIQLVPKKKMSWLVKNCFWSFLKQKSEWNGTTISWNIRPVGILTELSMTHIGLVPETECFNICKEGWGLYVGNSLFRLITESRGIPFDAPKIKISNQSITKK